MNNIAMLRHVADTLNLAVISRSLGPADQRKALTDLYSAVDDHLTEWDEDHEEEDDEDLQDDEEDDEEGD